jgi:hypothetical protein
MVPWRVVHNGDFAPAGIARKTKTFTYAHISREVWFSEGNQHFAVCDGSGEDPACSVSVPKLALRLLDHQEYMGYAFTNPCGGNAAGPALTVALSGAGGISCLMLLVFLIRVRRCQRLQNNPNAYDELDGSVNSKPENIA